MLTVEKVMDALKGVMDPELRRSLVELGMVKDVTIDGGQVRFTLALTTMTARPGSPRGTWTSACRTLRSATISTAMALCALQMFRR